MKPNSRYLLVVDDDADDWLFFEQEFYKQTPGTELVYKESGDALLVKFPCLDGGLANEPG